MTKLKPSSKLWEMSALGSLADITARSRHDRFKDIRRCSWIVRKVPLADIRAMADIIGYAVQFRDLRSHTPA